MLGYFSQDTHLSDDLQGAMYVMCQVGFLRSFPWQGLFSALLYFIGLFCLPFVPRSTLFISFSFLLPFCCSSVSLIPSIYKCIIVSV